jgi:long-chain fatty acid transport protein
LEEAFMRHVLRLIPVLLLGLGAEHADAAGFQLLEQNASGLGNAYAGSAAAAENASTIFFNPAGMTYLSGRQFSAGLNAVRPSFEFSNSGSLNPTALGGGAASGGNGGDAGSWAYLPNGYLSWALSRDLYVGVGVGAPFGLKTEYDPGWIGRYQSIKFDIKTLNINPSVAYRVNDAVSLGFGLNWQKFKTEYVRQATPASQVKLSTEDDSWGWNAGALFQVSPATRVGVSYRSAVRQNLDGNLSGALNAPASAEVKLPDTFLLSVFHVLDDRWELMGDLSRTGWSNIQKLDIVNKSTGTVADTLTLRWRDTWRVAVGASYKYNSAWKLKSGIAYDQSPVSDPQYRPVSLPDNNRVWLSIGAQYKPSKEAALDIGYAYLYMKDAGINNNGGSQATKGLVSGSYNGSGSILGIQYSQSF